MPRPDSLRSRPLGAISAQNVTSAHNYGIVKAGDGGNGGRGEDGKGGSDSTSVSTAPTAGSPGLSGGGAGAGGIAYLYGKNETGVVGSNGSSGTAGAHGNDGWGGLALGKFDGTWGFMKSNKNENNARAQLSIYTHASTSDATKVNVGIYVECTGDVKDYKHDGNILKVLLRKDREYHKELENEQIGDIYYTILRWDLYRMTNTYWYQTDNGSTHIEGYYNGVITSAVTYYLTIQ